MIRLSFGQGEVLLLADAHLLSHLLHDSLRLKESRMTRTYVFLWVYRSRTEAVRSSFGPVTWH